MNYETVILKTNRLIMQKGTKEDYLRVYEYDFNKLKNVDGECKLEKQDLSKINSLFNGGMKKYYSKLKKAHMFDWIIYYNNDAIGNVLTLEEDLFSKTIEISYNLHPSYWGNGFMPEALESAMSYLFSIGYDNIICTYSDGNIKSKRVLEKLGFKPYKIIKDSWKSDKGNMIDDYKTIMTKEDFLSRTSKINVIKNSL